MFLQVGTGRRDSRRPFKRELGPRLEDLPWPGAARASPVGPLPDCGARPLGPEPAAASLLGAHRAAPRAASRHGDRLRLRSEARASVSCRDRRRLLRRGGAARPGRPRRPPRAGFARGALAGRAAAGGQDEPRASERARAGARGARRGGRWEDGSALSKYKTGVSWASAARIRRATARAGRTGTRPTDGGGSAEARGGGSARVASSRGTARATRAARRTQATAAGGPRGRSATRAERPEAAPGPCRTESGEPPAPPVRALPLRPLPSLPPWRNMAAAAASASQDELSKCHRQPAAASQSWRCAGPEAAAGAGAGRAAGPGRAAARREPGWLAGWLGGWAGGGRGVRGAGAPGPGGRGAGRRRLRL